MAGIAVFDSGIGGTSVLDRIRERAPWADLIYVADHAFGPYGERSLGEVHPISQVGRRLRGRDRMQLSFGCLAASSSSGDA